MTYYKIAIIGLGSIGKRHLHNVSKVLSERNISYTVDVISKDANKLLENELNFLIDNIYSSYDNIPSDYDIVFITNPTYLHYQTIKSYAHKTKHMFIEKPVFKDSNTLIEDMGLNDEGIYYVACPLRYTEVIQYVKNKIDLSNVYSTRVICSSYLPDWRPGVDYRNTYSASISEGGGVSIDMIHEWDYIRYIFGDPEEVYNIRGKFSNLEIDSEDLSLYFAKYKNMLLEIHLDYFGRKTLREIQIFGKEDTIVADIANNEIRYLNSGKIVSFKESRNDYQIKEIKNFFDIIEGKEKNQNDILMALKTLKIAKDGHIE